MSLRLRLLELCIPERVARSAIRRLLEATASAFGCEPVEVNGLDRRMMLERYAAFTASNADRAVARRDDLDDLAHRMWSNAYAMGESLRHRLGVRTREDAVRAARIAYRMIDIDLRADRYGDVVVERCFFAERYSPAVCRLMSSLDAGVVAGLTGGGRLTFSERITEGRPRCIARIAWEGALGP